MKTDIYTDENNVLINKLNIKNAELLKAKEAALALINTTQVRSKKFAKYDFQTFCEIHKILFGDIYEWAGKPRTVDIAKSMLFCRAMFIQDQAKFIFDELAQRNELRNLPQDKFCDELGLLFCDLNMLHPFREGNGRTTREFIFHLARAAGYFCDLNPVDRQQYLQASIIGHTNAMPMIEIIKQITTKYIPHNLTQERKFESVLQEKPEENIIGRSR